MGLGWFEILLIAVIVLLLFGRGKISDLMGDVAKGIKSFRQGLADEPKELPHRTGDTAADVKRDEKTPV